MLGLIASNSRNFLVLHVQSHMAAFDTNVIAESGGGFKINIPQNTAVVMFGTVTAGWTQNVSASLQHDGNNPGDSWSDRYYQLEGSGQGFLTVTGVAMPKVASSPPVAEGGATNLAAQPPIPASMASQGEPLINIQPSRSPRHIGLSFRAERPTASGTQSVDSKVKWVKSKVTNYAIYFTFYAEDGGDGDNHDCTFTVSMLLAAKPNAAK